MSDQTITILAIESSCDDTSASVIRDGKILSNLVANQQIHELYGGVVPELASRAHQQNIVPVVDAALKKAGVSVAELNAIAFTAGPGLIGSLLVGTAFGKALASSLHLPIIKVHHMDAHILAHFIDNPKPSFPFMCLTISGGHTLINIVHENYHIEAVGHTLDDAAGEAFDKGAKLLGLPYPGGPLIDKLAQNGNPHAFDFPVPQISDFNFSFSGLKTSLMYFLKEKAKTNPDFVKQYLPDICASYQFAITKHLMTKLTKAAKQYQINHIGIAGGVSANSYIRNELTIIGQKQGWKTYVPDFQYCTDNAGMIAMSAYIKYLNGEFAPKDLSPFAR
jgi:N6-L-threonylcarbamoyladenine synthase